MTSYEFGDVLLVPFPFTDQTTIKKRPAVVISSQAYDHERLDLILRAITSQVKPSPAFGEIIIDGWRQAGLIKPGVIKPVVTTIEKTQVIRKLGRLEDGDRKKLQAALQAILG